jgi:hypothetical protein
VNRREHGLGRAIQVDRLSGGGDVHEERGGRQPSDRLPARLASGQD